MTDLALQPTKTTHGVLRRWLSMMKVPLSVFAPNRNISRTAFQALVGVQAAMLVILWLTSTFVFLPTPFEVWNAFWQLWYDGLGNDLSTSFFLNFEAILAASVVSLLMSYSTVMPFFRPIVAFLSKMRFLSLIGLTFFVTMMTRNGHELKLSLLAFSISVFFITSMADVLNAIPKEKFDLGRTLRMSEWRVVWEVVIVGQLDKVLDVLRQNAAIGWMMLTMVESMSRSEGGVGAVLTNQNKHFHLSAVLAIQITILLLGLFQDYAIGLIRRFLFPYADLTVERK